MSTNHNLQSQREMQHPCNAHAHISVPIPTFTPPSMAVTPSKRSDDDIQFISSKPVKRRKISEQKSTSEQRPQFSVPIPPMAFPNPTPLISLPVPMPVPTPIPAPPMFPMQTPTSPITDPKEGGEVSERRLSTGMVGLPSDFHAVELSYGLRGVSLPVLEKFALNQPPRGPRPPSPPELSPKQLPQTITPAMLSLPIHNRLEEFGRQETPSQEGGVSGTGNNPVERTTPHQDRGNVEPTPNKIHVLNTPVSGLASPSPVPTEVPRQSNTKAPSMPPPPIPRSEQSQANDPMQKCPSTTGKSCKAAPKHGIYNQPCQICARMRQQANVTRAPGLPPMIPQNPPPHQFIPQMPCHQAYAQHLQPHMMGIPSNGMHAFAPGFPMMMPIQGNGFPNLAAPSHMVPQPPPQHVHRDPGTHSRQQQFPGRKPDSPACHGTTSATAASPTNMAQDNTRSPKPVATTPVTAATTTTSTPTASSPSDPVKPPATLIQPTYRKRSPNLIVDVAETCQEHFPFEEVARRHNAPVAKVFDIFAAIIQVPLLRCPTDRRRAGKLATSRIKEYARARKDILDSRGGVGDGRKGTGTGTSTPITPSEIAQHMGTADFPEGFNLGSNGQQL